MEQPPGTRLRQMFAYAHLPDVDGEGGISATSGFANKGPLSVAARADAFA